MKKIINKFILTIVLGSCGFISFGNPQLASKQQIGMFKNSKTCIVLEEGRDFYNAFIKDAVQKYWKSTEYEFIDLKEFENRRHNSKYSFLILMKGTFDKDPGGVSYSYLSLVLGDPTTNISKMPELCSLPLSYSEDNDIDYGYILPSMVKFMQIHAKNLEYKRFFISLKGLRYYNGLASLKDKALLFNKDMMAPEVNTLDKIKAVYPNYVNLVSTAEMQTGLASSPPNTLFNFHVGPKKDAGAGKCFEMIFDIDGNLYYYNSRKVTNDNEDGFNLNDFNRIR